MKKNFTISIEESLIKSIKCCAVSNETTSSNLISEYIKAIKKTNGSIIRAIPVSYTHLTLPTNSLV